MPAQTFAEYSIIAANIVNALHLVRNFDRYEFQSDQRSLHRGFLQGVLWFSGGSELHWREFVDTANDPQRSMYAYHFQDTDKNCLFRYDNAAHRPALGFIDHKHCRDGSVVAVNNPPTLEEVVSEVLRTLQG